MPRPLLPTSFPFWICLAVSVVGCVSSLFFLHDHLLVTSEGHSWGKLEAITKILGVLVPWLIFLDVGRKSELALVKWMGWMGLDVVLNPINLSFALAHYPGTFEAKVRMYLLALLMTEDPNPRPLTVLDLVRAVRDLGWRMEVSYSSNTQEDLFGARASRNGTLIEQQIQVLLEDNEQLQGQWAAWERRSQLGAIAKSNPCIELPRKM